MKNMKQILVDVPIEPIEDRYSIQWSRWFLDYYHQNGIQCTRILPGGTSGKISDGCFLDVVETNLFKTKQTQALIKLINSHRVQMAQGERLIIFFHDLWFPGLVNLAYIRDGLDLRSKIKLCGCLHAGSYDVNDFLGRRMFDWALPIEVGMFGCSLVDEIYVATKYHSDLLGDKVIRYGSGCFEKVHVTGFPMFPEFIDKEQKKENIVVFPHRLDDEKQPLLFKQLAATLGRTFPDWSFICTKEVTNSKSEYYKILNRSKIAVSFALQETWGIAMQEAALCGAVPISPCRLSYPEIFPKQFLYGETFEHACNKVTEVIRNMDTYMAVLTTVKNKIITDGASAIPNIIGAALS